MISDAAFQRMIQEHPDDDGPRLVYADWLEESGRCERAEFIRLECSGDSGDRCEELVRAHGASWAGPAATFAYSYAFRRGFVEEITISATMLLDHGAELFDFAPIRLLRIIGARPVLKRLVEWPTLGRIEALHLTGCNVVDDGAILLANCRYLRGLRTLRVGQNAIGDSGAEALADSPHLRDLQTLALHGNQIGDAGAHALATARHLNELRVLDLSDNQIGDGGAEALAHSSGFAHLMQLDLANQFKGRSPGLPLLSWPYPIQPAQREALIERFGELVCVF